MKASASAERSGTCDAGCSFPAQTIPAGGLLQRRIEPGGVECFEPEQGRVAVGQRRLVGGSADVARQHARVRVIEDRRLDSAPEQLVGLAHEVLIESVLARHEHRQAVIPTPGAAPLLAQRCNGTREAD